MAGCWPAADAGIKFGEQVHLVGLFSDAEDGAGKS
jgi:hypothetical protein